MFRKKKHLGIINRLKQKLGCFMKWFFCLFLCFQTLIAYECNCYDKIHDHYKYVMQDLEKFENEQFNDEDTEDKKYANDIAWSYDKGYVHGLAVALKILRMGYYHQQIELNKPKDKS